MSQIVEANDQILTKILKTDPFYEALWGKEKFFPEAEITEPNDFNCGAIANGLEYVYEFIRQITAGSLDDLDDPYIDIVVYFFTRIQRLPGESNENLVNRMKSLLVRTCEWRSPRMETPWDILNVFCYYIDRSLLYYVPNCVLTDLIVNGDFEDPIGAEWTISPSGDRTIGDAFTGSYQLDFSGFNSASQTVAVESGSYILHGFVKPLSGPPSGFAATWNPGDGNFENAAYTDQDAAFATGGGILPSQGVDTFNLLIQRDSDNYYYDVENMIWQSGVVSNTFTSKTSDWNLLEWFIVNDGTYNIEITFSKIVDFSLDRVEFGKKEYPCFEILFIDSGPAVGFASAWLEANFLYQNASFLDQDAAFDTSSGTYTDVYYQSLLDTIKAAGVKGVFVRAERDLPIEPPSPQSYNLSTGNEELITTSDGFIFEVLSI